MDFRKNHRGSFLCLSILILSFLLFATILQGCGKPQDPDGPKNYHTITKNGQTWYVLDEEYTGDYDLQKIWFLSQPREDNMDGEILYPLEGRSIPKDFRQETVMDRAAYETYCERFGLTPAFPEHKGGYAVLACVSESLSAVEVQVADAIVEGDTLRLLVRDHFHSPYPDSLGFVLTVPVSAEVTKLETVPVYNASEAENIQRYGTPNNPNETAAPEKPVIYLYPEAETLVTVKLDFDGELTCTYPSYGDGWAVTAAPDGTLTDAEGRIYSYLYWEGAGEGSWDFSKGFCVRGADTAAFLEKALADLGLTRREANEFIVYWLPRMEDNPWNLIAFQNEAYTDRACLTVDPAPDTVIRVFMAWQALEAPIDIEPQTLTAPERSGFTLVEWGGAEQLTVDN